MQDPHDLDIGIALDLLEKVQTAVLAQEAKTGRRPSIAIVPRDCLMGAPGADLPKLGVVVIPDDVVLTLAPSVVGDEVSLLREENRRYKEREAHWAHVLDVADKGEYRADWDSRIRALIEERNRLREEHLRLVEAAKARSARVEGLTSVAAAKDRCIELLRSMSKQVTHSVGYDEDEGAYMLFEVSTMNPEGAPAFRVLGQYHTEDDALAALHREQALHR